MEDLKKVVNRMESLRYEQEAIIRKLETEIQVARAIRELALDIVFELKSILEVELMHTRD